MCASAKKTRKNPVNAITYFLPNELLNHRIGYSLKRVILRQKGSRKADMQASFLWMKSGKFSLSGQMVLFLCNSSEIWHPLKA
jgi:hypothetical protein